ncbi:MAG: hypothetical protein L0387_20255 [Acidobacteria bacterium]|nr:hypothetical protein [Acidobacteriota bacterium]MCI0623956.1 hypothetical protein [Acidobacteriota bacterium]MCI0722582.1 hypothetical protein [Acidobacteriota bacterium]
MMELQTLVIYDVEDDWARIRVAEACKGFGLDRIRLRNTRIWQLVTGGIFGSHDKRAVCVCRG